MRKFESFVTSVSWERIHMFLNIKLADDAKVSENVQFFLANENYVVEAAFDILEKKTQKHRRDNVL